MSSRYTTVPLVLFFLLALAYPSLSAQPAPARVEQSIALQPGDNLTITCQSSLALTKSSSKQWIVRCKATSAATPVAPTATSPASPVPTVIAATPTKGIGPSANAPAWHSLSLLLSWREGIQIRESFPIRAIGMRCWQPVGGSGRYPLMRRTFHSSTRAVLWMPARASRVTSGSLPGQTLG